MPRGDGVPWTERENLALTISAKAHQVTPVPAAWTLRAVAGGPDVEPDAFERAAEALSGHIWRWRGGYCHRGGRGLSASTRRQMARVTLLRLTHATARPTHRRHPPFGWYAKAAKVSRETIYRRHWRPLIQELEDTAEQWRDSGASRLAALLEPLGIIE